MATTKAKRSVHPSKAVTRNHRVPSTRHPDRRKPAERRTQKRSSLFHPFRKLVHFPHAKGKTVEDVEISSTSDYHNISINFQDKTALNFSIETGFTLKPDYSDWKSGNQKVLRAWRPMHNKR